MKYDGSVNMVFSQCVQLSQFDSQLVNAQCSDSSVLCACLKKRNRCLQTLVFSLPPLISGSEPQRASVIIRIIRINHLEDLFVKTNMYGLKIFVLLIIFFFYL